VSEPTAGANIDAPSVGRLISFSDAVFAIAITLLALQLRVPEIRHKTSANDLSRALGDLSGQFFTYGITFALIGIYWLGHHRMFQRIVSSNRRLAQVNLLFLLTVSFFNVNAASRLWFVAFPALLVMRILSRDPED
jgi:uncharacterized membrane protein